MRYLYLLLLPFFFLLSTNLKADDCNNGRYQKPVFSRVQVINNIYYATRIQSDNKPIHLRYDIYQPAGDTLSQRPVMLLIHGGAYLKLLDQSSPDIVLMCNYFAKLGYVAVSINYRQEPNPLSLLSGEKMVKAVGRALLDTKEAVDHLMLTYQNGNPFRIDTSRAFIGGVSAGAVSSLFITFLDSIAMLPPQFQAWVNEVEPQSDSILKHKFDLVKPKAAISISGAISDLSWIRNVGIDLFLNHGSADELVPYRTGKPFGLPDLPTLSGGKDIYPLAVQAGIRTYFEDWEGRGHVPFMNLDFGSIITLQLINQPILDTTLKHITEFIYPLLGCEDEKATSIRQNKIADLKLYPNPSNGIFNIDMPKRNNNQEGYLQLFDLNGKLYVERKINAQESFLHFDGNLAAGQYFIKLSFKDKNIIDYYTSSFSVVK